MKKLDFAIQMENEGVQYYQDQAQLHQADPLHRVFEQLAVAEKRHADLLTRHAAGMSYSLTDDKQEEGTRSVFAGLANFKNEIFEKPGQLEAYRFAIVLEQRSVDLYKSMLSEAETDLDRTLMEYLISKEKEHLTLFNELEVLLNRPVEWVEAAEFGSREEY